MKRMRIVGVAALAILLAFAISACQKKAEIESSQSGEGYGTNTETPAADQTAQTTPPAEQGAGPAAPVPAAEKHSKPGTGSKVTESKGAKTGSTSSGSTSSGSTPSGTYASRQKTVEVPVGTVFDVEMVTPVDTRTSNVGDKVEANLAAAITHDGVIVAEQGAPVRGEISDLKRASRSKGAEDRASVTLTFTSIQTVDGEKTLHATVTNSEGKLVAKSTSTRDKLIIGGGTVAGAIIGKVAGKDTKSTIIGAVGGAVAGTGAVLAAKGYELQVPAGSKVSLRVDQPVTVVSK